MSGETTIHVLNFTGRPISEAEIAGVFFASILYLREKKSGEVRFRFRGIEGYLEAAETAVIGSTRGTVFNLDLGEDREIHYILPSMYENLDIPEDTVVFLTRRRTYAGGKEQSLH